MAVYIPSSFHENVLHLEVEACWVPDSCLTLIKNSDSAYPANQSRFTAHFPVATLQVHATCQCMRLPHGQGSYR